MMKWGQLYEVNTISQTAGLNETNVWDVNIYIEKTIDIIFLN